MRVKSTNKQVELTFSYAWVKVQKFPKSLTFKTPLLNIHNFKFKWFLDRLKILSGKLLIIRKVIIISLIQHFEADFLRKVSLNILNSETILKTFSHAFVTSDT